MTPINWKTIPEGMKLYHIYLLWDNHRRIPIAGYIDREGDFLDVSGLPVNNVTHYAEFNKPDIKPAYLNSIIEENDNDD